MYCKYIWILMFALTVMNLTVLCCSSATVDICMLDVFYRQLLIFQSDLPFLLSVVPLLFKTLLIKSKFLLVRI